MHVFVFLCVCLCVCVFSHTEFKFNFKMNTDNENQFFFVRCSQIFVNNVKNNAKREMYVENVIELELDVVIVFPLDLIQNCSPPCISYKTIVLFLKNHIFFPHTKNHIFFPRTKNRIFFPT